MMTRRRLFGLVGAVAASTAAQKLGVASGSQEAPKTAPGASEGAPVPSQGLCPHGNPLPNAHYHHGPSVPLVSSVSAVTVAMSGHTHGIDHSHSAPYHQHTGPAISPYIQVEEGHALPAGSLAMFAKDTPVPPGWRFAHEYAGRFLPPDEG